MNFNNSIKIAFIGCGNIAHIHILFLKKIGMVPIAVCDASLLRARIFAEQYGIENFYDSIDTLLQQAKPDAIHVLTPPHTHYKIILQALRGDCHVFVEKPLCETKDEYEEIMHEASRAGLLVSVDHTRIFHPMILRAQEIVQEGEIGLPLRLEYNYDDPSLIKSNRNSKTNYRWARGTPPWFSTIKGGALTDLMPHPISVFLLFAPDLEVKHVESRCCLSGIIEELHVLFSSKQVCADFHLSLNQKPLKNTFRIYAERGSIETNLRNMYMLVHQERQLPGIISRSLTSLSKAGQITISFFIHICKLLLKKYHPYSGLEKIFELFYQQIQKGDLGELPGINAEKVVRLQEEIIASAIQKYTSQNPPTKEKKIPQEIPANCDALVLGGTGFIGRTIVEKMQQLGKSVRVLCRPTSITDSFQETVQIVRGDLRNKDSLAKAMAGVDSVIHCAAAMSGDWAEFYESTVTGTQNVLECALENKIQRLVYISSIGILNYNKLKDRQVVDENSPLESLPGDRGFYTKAKKEAEDLVLNFARNHAEISVIILRPGLVYGRESNYNLQNAGILLGKILAVFGMGRRNLGLIYVENLVGAIILALERDIPTGTVIHLVDTEQPTVKEIIHEHNRLGENKIIPIYIPVVVWNIMFSLVDSLLAFKNKKRGTFKYRFASNSRVLSFDTTRSRKILGWTSRINWKDAFKICLKND